MENNTIHVLLVDDDAEYAAIAKHYLRSFHNKKFELTWSIDGESALRVLSPEKMPDIVLMDYYLPNTNGFEVTQTLRNAKLNAPVILLTANKDFRIAIEAMKFGIEEYLVKDEAVETILPRTIVNVLERVQLKKQIQEAEKEKILSMKKSEAVQELVVTMCHEFNNPLAAIKISTDILSRQKTNDEQRDLLEKLNRNITLLEKQIIKLRDTNAEK